MAGHFRETEGYHVERTHGTDDWLLIYTRSGRGLLKSAGRELKTNPGQAVLYAPRTPHDYGLVSNAQHWELLWAHFAPRPEWLEMLRWPRVTDGLSSLTLDDAVLRQRFEHSMLEAAEYSSQPLKSSRHLAYNSLERALLWSDLLRPKPGQVDPRVRRAAELLCEKWEPLPSLARRCGISPSRLSHLFREQLRTTPRRFHEEQKLSRARLLLEHTDRTISEIADELGFKSAYYFSTRFKQFVGTSPLPYRTRRRKESSPAPARSR